jgi:hypothetical protein
MEYLPEPDYMQFNSQAVCEIIEIKKSRLDTWLNQGYVSPSLQGGQGTGSSNRYCINDLYTIAAFKQITEAGFDRKKTARVLSSGIITPAIDASEYHYLALIRYGDKTKGALIKRLRSNSSDVVYQLDQLGFEDFDDIFLINFFKLRREVDGKADEYIRNVIAWAKKAVTNDKNKRGKAR